MVESTCFQHTSSHPDKYNNSVNRIISKEEEREDPRRDTSVFFEYSGVSTYNPFYKNYSVSTHNPATPRYFLHTELILPQEILQLQGSCRADHYKASSSDCSRTSKHSTRQNKAPSYPTAFQAYTALAGFQLILPAETAFQAAASIHTAPTVAPRCIPTEFYQEK